MNEVNTDDRTKVHQALDRLNELHEEYRAVQWEVAGWAVKFRRVDASMHAMMDLLEALDGAKAYDGPEGSA